MSTKTRTHTRELQHFTLADIERMEYRLELLGAVRSSDGVSWHLSTLGGARPLGECVAWMLEALAPDAGADAGENWRRGNVGSRCVVRSDIGIVCDTGSLLDGGAVAISCAERLVRAHYIATRALALQDLITGLDSVAPGAGV